MLSVKILSHAGGQNVSLLIQTAYSVWGKLVGDQQFNLQVGFISHQAVALTQLSVNLNVFMLTNFYWKHAKQQSLATFYNKHSDTIG